MVEGLVLIFLWLRDLYHGIYNFCALVGAIVIFIIIRPVLPSFFYFVELVKDVLETWGDFYVDYFEDVADVLEHIFQ